MMNVFITLEQQEQAYYTARHLPCPLLSLHRLIVQTLPRLDALQVLVLTVLVRHHLQGARVY
jgi:hypothetical protein